MKTYTFPYGGSYGKDDCWDGTPERLLEEWKKERTSK